MNTIVRFAIRLALIAIVMTSAVPWARAQETDQLRQRQRPGDRSAGRVVPGAQVTARQTRRTSVADRHG